MLRPSKCATAAANKLTLPVTCDTDKLVKPINAAVFTQPALNANIAPPQNIHLGSLVIIVAAYTIKTFIIKNVKNRRFKTKNAIIR